MTNKEKSIENYIFQTPILQDQSIVLRALNTNDIDDLKMWMPEQSLYTYWGKKPGKTDKNPELLFAYKKKTKSIHWGIVDVISGKVMGDYYLYLIENNRMAKIAYRVSSKYQRQGIATKATEMVLNFVFQETELQRIWTEVDVRNRSSEVVLIKNQFVKEGMIRQGKMVNTYCDYYVYAILKKDYIENNQKQRF